MVGILRRFRLDPQIKLYPQITPITQIKTFHKSGLPTKFDGGIKPLVSPYQEVCESSNTRTQPALFSESKIAETVV